jgi:hypothetical protein
LYKQIQSNTISRDWKKGTLTSHLRIFWADLCESLLNGNEILRFLNPKLILCKSVDFCPHHTKPQQPQLLSEQFFLNRIISPFSTARNDLGEETRCDVRNKFAEKREFCDSLVYVNIMNFYFSTPALQHSTDVRNHKIIFSPTVKSFGVGENFQKSCERIFTQLK